MNDKMMNRIQALLAKAESTTSTHEADAYSAKAEELMLAYGIERSMLDAKKGSHSDKIVTKHMYFTGSYDSALVTLAWSTCRSLGTVQNLLTKSGWDPNTKKKAQALYLIGYESDVDAAIVLITSLQLQALSAQKRWWSTFDGKQFMSGMDKFVERRSFIEGFGRGAAARIKETMSKAEATYEQEHGEGCLVPVKNHRAQSIDAYISETYNVSKGRGGNRRGGMHGGGAGQAAGRNADTGGTRVSGGRQAIGR
jgi:hypothetical protein